MNRVLLQETFQVITAVKVHVVVFLIVTLCMVGDGCQLFGGTLHVTLLV
jgi:hypothetical protein